MTQKIEIKLWVIGVVMLAVLISLEPLLMPNTAFSVLDHQAAATAERANEIQSAWRDEGYFGTHLAGMFGDLIFICVYSLGTWRAGQGLRAQPGAIARAIGALVLALAVVFFITDIVETSLQVIQMIMDQGVDWMAGTAAFMQPIKMAAWVLSFFAVLIGLIVARLGRGSS